MWWPSALLATVVLVDGILSMRPPAFVRRCLDGVRFPQDYWWVLVVVKFLAVAGFLAGYWRPDIGLAAHVGVVAYFLCAAIAHLRAKYVGRDFWLNCLGMLTLSAVTLALHLALR